LIKQDYEQSLLDNAPTNQHAISQVYDNKLAD